MLRRALFRSLSRAARRTRIGVRGKLLEALDGACEREVRHPSDTFFHLVE
jgi:hypothetical protein